MPYKPCCFIKIVTQCIPVTQLIIGYLQLMVKTTSSPFKPIFCPVPSKAASRFTQSFSITLFFCYHCVSAKSFPFLSLSVCNLINRMPHKWKEVAETQNPLIHPQADFHHTPLVDKYFKIHESLSKFDLFEIYYWMEDQFIDQTDKIRLWDSHLPHYIFPQIHRAPEFFRKCHASYDPNQRAIISPTG